MTGLTTLDIIAFAVFAGGWIGYVALIEWSPLASRTLNVRIDRYRQAWMRNMLVRDNRIVDTQIMASLQNGTAFFASTSLIAIGGALALMRVTDEVFEVFAALPFTIETTRAIWELKVIGLAVMFVYAFFKFAWAYRIFNYAAIVLGAVAPDPEHTTPQAAATADMAGRLITIAGHHFNRGQRAFFFTLAYLGWFLHPWVLIGATAAVLLVMLRRQFGAEAQSVLP